VAPPEGRRHEHAHREQPLSHRSLPATHPRENHEHAKHRRRNGRVPHRDSLDAAGGHGPAGRRVDRAKAFYESLGWRLDIDFSPVKNTRGVHFTPPGSPSSIQFGKGLTTNTEPLQGLILVVDDIDVAREDLIDRGVDVSEVWHLDPDRGPVGGRDPENRSYFSRASFADPDGNQWQLQEITERLPGRV
jgi:catechol 2,3-dioxygenase-like lactoylglutathione lyase family enzyme